jgi:DUF917 family protein
VTGGAILGGGGGGHVADGVAIARRALACGRPELWSLDELPGDALTITVAVVGAPGATGAHVSADQHVRALRLAEQALGDRGPIAAINTNENGAATTVNGWLQAAVTGLPVLDAPCNGRAHPTGLMGSLGLHRDRAFVSVQGFAGGRGAKAIEGSTTGSLESVAALVRRASAEAGGLVAVARNPVRADVLGRRGAPGGVTEAIRVGLAHARGGVAGVARYLGGRVAGEGRVALARCELREGFDVGEVVIEGAPPLRLRFVNEYLTLHAGARRVAGFPDLVMTFDARTGAPVVSADVRRGQRLAVLCVPATRLLLSSTMFMPELLAPVARLLGVRLAPPRPGPRRRRPAHPEGG